MKQLTAIILLTLVTGCTALKDADGNPVLDSNGKPIMVLDDDKVASVGSGVAAVANTFFPGSGAIVSLLVPALAGVIHLFDKKKK